MKMLMAVAVALMLAGCGGGSKGGVAGSPSVQTPTTPRPTVRVASLPVLGEPETPTVVVEIPDNTVRITPGQTREVSVGGRSVSIRCPSGGASCHVGVHEGSLWYRLDAAIPFALASLPSPTPEPGANPRPVVGLPDDHGLETGEIPAGKAIAVDFIDFGEEDLPYLFISCRFGGAACSLTVADDGTVTYTGGTLTVSSAQHPGFPVVASVTGYGRWSRSDYGFISTHFGESATGDGDTWILYLDPEYKESIRFPDEQRLTFQGNAYSNDGLTGTINLNYNRGTLQDRSILGTVDVSINDSQSRNLFRMSGISVYNGLFREQGRSLAQFYRLDGTDEIMGSFISRVDGTGVDRAAGIASTSTRAMVFDIPKM